MLSVTSIIGNIFDNSPLRDQFKKMKSLGFCENLKISRIEMERSRLRRKTDLGTDVGLILEDETKMRHGDVIFTDSQKFIIIEQIPEKIISIKLNKKNSTGFLVTLGHIIGNRHKPISIKDDLISFPIQSDAEIEVFRNLLLPMIGKTELKVEEQIFQPQHGTYLHEH